MTWFGAVEFESRKTFEGLPDPERPDDKWHLAMFGLEAWLVQFPSRPIFVSDNPAYDWQWINYHFWHTLGRNPFGHSARRISDFYAGLCNNFYKTQEWKRLRVTKHDHNPVNDAMGNVEAFERLLAGAR